MLGSKLTHVSKGHPRALLSMRDRSADFPIWYDSETEDVIDDSFLWFSD